MNFKMKTSRILALVLALSMMACLLAACGGSDSGSDKKYKMQAILISSSSQVTAGQGKAMEDYAKEKGVDFSVAFYDQNIATEAELIENAVTSGVDCLILHNQSEGDCVDAINAAVDAGVTVVLYATDVPEAKYSYLITENAYDVGVAAGKMAGEWANENLVANGRKVVAAFGNYSVTQIAVDRSNGFKEGLKSVCPVYEDAGTYEMAYQEEGLKVGENLLQSHPDVNLICAINDQSGFGVMEALKAAGRSADEVGVFGIDGTDQGMYYIATDTMFKGTYAIPTNDAGRQLIDKGIELLDNGGGKGEQTVEYWESTKITKANVNDFKDIWGYLAES